MDVGSVLRESVGWSIQSQLQLIFAWRFMDRIRESCRIVDL